MNKIYFGLTMLSMLVGVTMTAQDNELSASYRQKFDRQVRNVGVTGVGVETIVSRWEEDCPDDPDMLVAKFDFNYAKSVSSGVVQRPTQRYLGEKPILTLKDSTGADVFYYQVAEFNDEYFSIALQSISRAVHLKPRELRYRFDKINALVAYEKDSPDMSYSEIKTLVSEYSSSKNDEWTLDSKPLAAGVDSRISPEFSQAMGEYCYALYKVGTPLAYDYFLQLSTMMNKLEPKNPVFIDNIGSYWQVAKKNNKKAEKYYKKALKIDPQDYAATTNLKIIQSSKSQKGQSGK